MNQRVLLTGATGYVGGRLLPLLVGSGYAVRCLARKPEHLQSRVPEGVEVVQGDVLDASSLARAMQGVDAAYYFVHSMADAEDFEDADRRAAENFGIAAGKAGVGKIIYLGGLAKVDHQAGLSPHLRSRHEVGRVLRASGAKVLELRASIIIGSGSLSFEMIRALVERLPIMITPRWVRVAAQPIFIGDVLAYLLESLKLELNESRVIEIGGPEVVSYRDLMLEYARQRGLKRRMVPVPVLTPGLSSLWLALVTPLFARVGRKLIDSVRHPSVIEDVSAMEDFSVRPVGVREAIARALRNEDAEFAQTRWSDALSSGRSSKPHSWGGMRYGNRLVDSRMLQVEASADAAFAVIEGIGGNNGWYFAQWLWRIRGWMDLLLGGVGMRRGRRDPHRLASGDVVDCWRVESIDPGKRLLLAAEMKLPGRAWLEFDVRPSPGGQQVQIRQTALFDPIGIVGLIYWYAVWPLHQIVFAGLLRNLARAASKRMRQTPNARTQLPAECDRP